ncbi:hypothetical protein H257_01905 [Aphanomyces astaci]|uniref:Uracil-DNA glycosylase-like domain-containing protein n=1 Tax=Aphanomyces astaci TaxID=112090 RepID=W4H5I2_APHAT|nr:hypothetical protein H257_01905 [Aphanomyces astaci]ETV86856.1 hypothetical protein H257_01905 [Aphanomyces astaci]|eukprot:XP_009823655.1 hypothetical protein H257_01905 [Aphanomyces astaci]
MTVTLKGNQKYSRENARMTLPWSPWIRAPLVNGTVAWCPVESIERGPEICTQSPMSHFSMSHCESDGQNTPFTQLRLTNTPHLYLLTVSPKYLVMFTKFRYDQGRVDGRWLSSNRLATIGSSRPTKRSESVEREDDSDARKKAKAAATVARKWQERYHSICDTCFDQVQECVHCPDTPLRLLIVGHNPSDHAWQSGYSYSNPTNRMWKLLAGEYFKTTWTGVLPPGWTMADQNKMPHVLGIGFSDLGIEPGNDASTYGRKTMTEWKHAFYIRLRRHLHRVAATLHRVDDASSCSNEYQHGPLLVAFSGKRQYSFLFDPPSKRAIPNGKQDPSTLPRDWPLPPSCEVWVLPSSSGRAAMSEAQRCQPYMDLAARFHQLESSDRAPNFVCDAIPTPDVPCSDEAII